MDKITYKEYQRKLLDEKLLMMNFKYSKIVKGEGAFLESASRPRQGTISVEEKLNSAHSGGRKHGKTQTDH